MRVRSRSASFYTLLITQTLSLAGSRMSGFAVAIWIYRQTGNVTPLALVTFFETVPTILLSNVAGMIADRFDRRYVMFFANVGQSISSVLLLLSLSTGHFEVWQLYLVAAVQSVFGVFLGPAFESSITMLVDDKQRDRANAVNQLMGPLAGVLAPGLAGVMYALIGVTGVVVVDLLSFLFAGATAIIVTIPRPEQTDEGRAASGSAWKEFVGGFSYLWSRKMLLFLVLYASVINFVFAAGMLLSTPYILSRTNNSEGTLGLLLSVMNAGAIAGGVVMSIWGGTRPRIHTIMPGLIIAAVMLALFGTNQPTWVLGVTLVILMFPLPMVNAAFMSVLQIKVPPDLQGRVFAVVGQLSMLLMPVAALIIGPLTDRVFEPAVQSDQWWRVAPVVGSATGAGMGLILVLSGATAAIVTLIVYGVPAVRHMEANLPDYLAKPKSEGETPSPEAAPVDEPELATV